MNRYDDEFVAEAVKLAETVGVKNASNQLGVPINTLNDWVYKGVRSPEKKAKKPGSPEEWEQRYNALLEKQKETEKKLAAAERRNTDLEEKVEVLQDCIGFFVTLKPYFLRR